MNAITGPWSPWISGILLGLMVPALYLVVGRRFGISSSLRHIGSMCMPRSNVAYLRDHNWKAHTWNLVFIGGLMAGAFLGANVLSDAPLEILPAVASTPIGIVKLLIGGVLVGFGARYAGGCTSGHTISGIANLEPASMAATAAFFVGGLTATWALPFMIL